MGPDSSAGGYGRRRGFGRAAAVLALALAAVAYGCGNSGHGAETNPEKGSDAEILNGALARELTILDAYTRGRPLLRGSRRPVGRQLRAQEQEYVDALTKAIRGLGGDTEAEAEELDFTRVKGQTGFLALAYELESAALASYHGNDPMAETVASLNANAVSFTFPVFTDGPHPTRVFAKPGQTPSLASLRTAIRQARQRHLRVTLRPALDEGNLTPKFWRGSIVPPSPKQWLASYGRTLVPYLKLAQREGVAEFVIGVELNSLTGYKKEWAWVSRGAARVYKGRSVIARENEMEDFLGDVRSAVRERIT